MGGILRYSPSVQSDTLAVTFRNTSSTFGVAEQFVEPIDNAAGMLCFIKLSSNDTRIGRIDIRTQWMEYRIRP